MRQATDSDTRQGTEHDPRAVDCPAGWEAQATAAAEPLCTLCTVRSHTDKYIII